MSETNLSTQHGCTDTDSLQPGENTCQKHNKKLIYSAVITAFKVIQGH